MTEVFTGLLLAKVISAILVVVWLTLVAEYISARLAGVLSGYPLGAAILLYFIGVEQGPVFAAEAAVYICAGFSSALAQLHGYYWASGLVRRKGMQVLVAAVLSVLIFLLSSALLKLLPNFTAVSAPLFTAVMMGLSMLAGRRIPAANVTARVPTTVVLLCIRASVAATVILTITGVAGVVGPVWAGLLAGFPVAVFPLLMLLHWSYSRDQAGTVVKNFPYGMGCLIVFTVICSQSFVPFGVHGGLALGFAAATLYLLGYSWLARRRRSGVVGD